MKDTATPGAPWEINTANGRLPIVRVRKMPHGEADTYTATIRTVSGEHVCVLDFGYGSKSDEAHARLIAAAPQLLSALKELVAVVRGECPSLLNEDSGGDARLSMAVDAAISTAEGRLS